MLMLVCGILIWSLVHFIPAAATALRSRLVKQLGLNPYKGVFSLLLVGGLVLIVLGWKATPVEFWYASPAWGPYFTIAGMLVASVFFFGPYIKSSLNRVIRHPQLTGVFIFGLAHLFSNGESRSVVLFGGLALWALVQMLLINRRDGAWVKPTSAGGGKFLLLLLLGAGFFLVITYAHGWLFGVSPVPYLGL